MNMRECSTSTTALTSAVTSSTSWRDVDHREPRLDGVLENLEELFQQVCKTRPIYASEIKESCQESSIHRKAHKTKSLIQFFAHAPKFQKNLTKGSYFACILFCGDKILTTNEDFLPVIEIDENYLSHPKLHFQWLMKVATTWKDIKCLRQDLEQAGSSSYLPFRIKLLQAVAYMQSVLGIEDLGQFYYKPIKDESGTHVLCTVRRVKTTKVSLTLRWTTLTKFIEKKKINTQGLNVCASDIIINNIENIILYSEVSNQPLERGLYLGYLKLHSSLQELELVVPANSPNIFPHVKIRDDPLISRAEWEWVINLNKDLGGCNVNRFSLDLELWRKKLIEAIHQLLCNMGVENNNYLEHRLYTNEVLELNSDVTLLLLLPPFKSVCTALSNLDDTLSKKSTLVTLPLYTFEMIQIGTYHPHILQKYSRLSYILEMDKLMAEHDSRKAFSQNEIAKTKERLGELKQFQFILDSIWKRTRWNMDAITFARDDSMHGIPLKALLYLYSKNSINKSNFQQMPLDKRKGQNSFRFVMKKQKLDNSTIQNESDFMNHSNFLNFISHAPKYEESSECLSHNNINLKCLTSNDISSKLTPKSIAYNKKNLSKGNQDTLEPNNLRQTIDLNLNTPKSSEPFSLNSSISALSPKLAFENHLIGSNTSSISLNEVVKPLYEKDSCIEEMDIEYLAPYGMSSLNTMSNDIGVELISNVLYSSDINDHKTEAATLFSRDSSIHSLSSAESETDAMSLISVLSEGDEGKKQPENGTILQVYAAYETGLTAGTSVKIHITRRTTAREVINLVVKQLNLAVLAKNKTGPIYSNEKLKDFCLVAVIGARERCLRDNFRPMQLQNPWKKGRLYIRFICDVLAALEQSQSTLYS